jgi:membrane protein
MGNRSSTPARPNHKKTQQAVQQAFSETEHAVRPGRGGIVSWLMGLGAGALVIWRGVRAMGQERPAGDNGVRDNTARTYRAEQSSYVVDRQDETGSPDLPVAALHGDSSAPVSAPMQATVTVPENPQVSKSATLQGGAMALAKEFIARYNNADCPARAAALSFFGLLSLVPLMLFAVAALGFFIHDPNQARQYVEHVVSRLLPGQQASQAANQVIQQTNVVDSARSLMNGKWWSILFGFLSLIYAGLGLFVSAADPMNATWEVKETRSFLRLRLICLGVFAGAGLFFLLSVAVSAGLWQPAGLPWIVSALLTVFYEALAIALNVVMFTLVYRFLPNTTVTWRAAAFGGVVTGILYEIAKKGFEFYLTNFGNVNNKMYGALGGVVLLVTWIYYGSMLLLAGAIVGKMYHEHREEGGVRQRSQS